MKFAFIVFAVLVFYFILEIGLFYYRTAHLPVLSKIDQGDRNLGSGPPLRYIAGGDSTAVGYGASGYQKTYAYKVAEYLALSHTVAYKNIAVKGYKTQDVLDKQLDQIIGFKPDIVTISMGANDATHLLGNGKIINNYKNIISKLEKQTSAKIYITDIANFREATLMPWFYIKLVEIRSKTLNKQILALETDRVKMVNIHNFGWSAFPDLSVTFAADRFHPNDIGYQNWANAFLDRINRP